MAEQQPTAPRAGTVQYLPRQTIVLSAWDRKSGILLGQAGTRPGTTQNPVAELRESTEGPLPSPLTRTVHRRYIKNPVIHVASSTTAAFRLTAGDQSRVRPGDVLFVPAERVAGIYCPPVLQRPLAITAPPPGGNQGSRPWPGSFYALRPPVEESAGSWLYERGIAMARALLPAPDAQGDARVFSAWTAAGFDAETAAGPLHASPAEVTAAVDRYITGVVMPQPRIPDGLRAYERHIAEAIGYADPATLTLVEDAMRDEARSLSNLDGPEFDELARSSAETVVFVHAGYPLLPAGRGPGIRPVPEWMSREPWPWHNLDARAPAWRPGSRQAGTATRKSSTASGAPKHR